jgi:hypothetical protein
MQVVLLLNSLKVGITITGSLGNSNGIFIPRSFNTQNSYHPVYMYHVSISFRYFYSNLANSGIDLSRNTISREQIRFAEANISSASQDIACPLSNPVSHIRILQNPPSPGT